MTNKIALIIDDVKSNRHLLEMILKNNAITPIAIESPRMIDQALAGVERVDVVFLDIEFPNYNGMDLVHPLKAMPALQSAPIIAYTVHTSEVEAARAAGFDGFLGKPLNAHQIADSLARIMNGESVWESY